MIVKYKREKIVSNIYETSKSKKDAGLFTVSERRYNVYDLDQVKDEFCREYRHDEK